MGEARGLHIRVCGLFSLFKFIANTIHRCAANHFHNPPRYTACRGESCNNPNCNHLPHHPAQQRQIEVIEHYANQKDFVARIGVLNFVEGHPSENQYVGKVFTRLDVGGHFFTQHYLVPMFHGDSPEFLSEVVDVDENTAVRRAFECEGESVDAIVDGISQSEGAKGKTVMQLSRLWRYKDGKVPG